jgi:hypothetical protein
VHRDDVPSLPPERKGAVLSFGVPPSPVTGPVWLPHLHLIVVHRDISGPAVRRAFAHKFPGANCVHVAPFHKERTPGENVGRIVGYNLKNRSATRFEGNRSEEWPIEWKVQLEIWLHSIRGGLRPLRISVGARTQKELPRKETEETRDDPDQQEAQAAAALAPRLFLSGLRSQLAVRLHPIGGRALLLPLLAVVAHAGKGTHTNRKEQEVRGGLVRLRPRFRFSMRSEPLRFPAPLLTGPSGVKVTGLLRPEVPP